MMIEGNIVAWPNVMTDFIRANHNNNTANVSDLSYPLLTDYETSWLASLPSFSTIPFVLFSGTIISIVGLKGSTTIGLVLAIVAWLLMGLTSSKAALFVGQAISGAALAFIGMVTQPLVSELVSPEIRGATASLPKVFSILGTLEINIANIFLPWYQTTLLCAVPFVVFLVFISFVPEAKIDGYGNKAPRGTENIRWFQHITNNELRECTQ
ncbi:uncharacterized protein LOC143030223 [Oratosquilla oratoria]|uniref:uncharacterized protein LOC143030223 n=1 Tax=Oratosquilla oratoria TaxID=337810 RepID=UPI003F7741BE